MMMMMVVVMVDGVKAIPMVDNKFPTDVDSFPTMTPGSSQLAGVVLPSSGQWHVAPVTEQHLVICSGQYILLTLGTIHMLCVTISSTQA